MILREVRLLGTDVLFSVTCILTPCHKFTCRTDRDRNLNSAEMIWYYQKDIKPKKIISDILRRKICIFNLITISVTIERTNHFFWCARINVKSHVTLRMFFSMYKSDDFATTKHATTKIDLKRRYVTSLNHSIGHACVIDWKRVYMTAYVKHYRAVEFGNCKKFLDDLTQFSTVEIKKISLFLRPLIQ